MSARVPFPYVKDLPERAQRELRRNFAELEKLLDTPSITGYDAFVVGGITDRPNQRLFGTVHSAATYLDGIGVTDAAILLTGTVTETAALAASDAPTTMRIDGKSGAIWKHDSNASAWNTLAVNDVDIRPGTSKATQVFTTTALTLSNCGMLTDLPGTTPINLVSSGGTTVLYRCTMPGGATGVGGVRINGDVAIAMECSLSGGENTFSATHLALVDCRSRPASSATSWAVSGRFVYLDCSNDNGAPNGATLTINVTAATFLQARWGQAGNVGNVSQNPMYVSLNVTSANLRSASILGNWLGKLTLPTSLTPSEVTATFGQLDVTGPANLNCAVGNSNATFDGLATLRGTGISGSLTIAFQTTSATVVNCVGLVGANLIISPYRKSGSTGTSKPYAFDASSSRNVFIYPRSATAASVFGSAGTDAGSSNLVIDESGIPSAGLPDIITAGGPTGSATVAPVITYDAKGRLTAVTTATIDAIQETLIDAKGDLVVGSANDTAIRKAVGTDGQVLVADSASTGGVKWATLAPGVDELDDLDDVDTSGGVVDRQLLVYSTALGLWVPDGYALGDLGDVDISSPNDGDLVYWNNPDGVFQAQAPDLAIASAFAPTAYTPAITATSFNLGNGTVDGWYIKIGKWVFGSARVTLGNAGGVNVGSGAYAISLPFTTDSTYYTASGTGATRHAIGTWTARDDSSGTIYGGVLRLGAASTSTAVMNISAGGTVGAANIGDGSTAVANEDEFFIQFGFWTAS